MDSQPITTGIPQNSFSLPPSHKHKYIIIFVSCLVVLIVIAMFLALKPETSPTDEMLTEDQKIINAMSAESLKPLTAEEREKILNTMSAPQTKPLTEDERAKILDAMNAK